VVTHGCASGIRLLAQAGCIEAIGRAQGGQQRPAMLRWAIPLGKGIKHLDETNGKQSVGLEALLMAEQMKLHQQLVDKPAVQWGDHIGKRAVKGTFAVSNSGRGAQAIYPG
jgi:hypothetical protein